MSRSEYQCPYCDTGIDAEGEDAGADGDIVDCPDCEKPFRLSANHSVTYEAKGDCALIKALPHKLKKGWSEASPYQCTTCKSEFYDWQFPDGRFPNLKAGEYEILK